LALAAIALLFNRSERIRQDKLADRREKEARLIEERREKEADLIERRRTQDSSLQSYLDEMAQFLLYRDDATGKLVRVGPGPGVQSVLRARTLLPSDQQEETFERFDVNLKNALLTNANFAGADLRGVDLTGAKLDGAELDPVDLRYAEIEDEQLAQCWELVGTVMPDGSIYEWPAVRLEFTELLNGVSLPVTKQDLIRQARSLGCLRNVIVALMRLVNIEECTDKGELEERFKDETMNIASDVWVSLNCTSEPEKTTVTNDTDSKITIYKITSAYQRGPGEPKVVNRTPEPGESITFQSGPTVEENVLLERAMYNNEAGRQEGTIVYTSAGRCTARC
jgi:hypothetical protein